MLLLRKGDLPLQFTINYDVAEDGKTPSDITAAKFFLALYPHELDDKYLLKTWAQGVMENAGVWTIQLDEGDLDGIPTEHTYTPVLAIQYAGETGYREPQLFETLPSGNEVQLQAKVFNKYSDV